MDAPLPSGKDVLGDTTGGSCTRHGIPESLDAARTEDYLIRVQGG